MYKLKLVKPWFKSKLKKIIIFKCGGGDIICLSGPVSKADFYNDPERGFGHI